MTTLAPALKSHTSQANWWRDVYYTDFRKGIRKVQTRVVSEAGDRARQEAAAWCYELVRRLPEVKTKKVRLPGFDQWLPFIDLPWDHQTALVWMVQQHLGYRPVFRTTSDTEIANRTGYSDPLPPMKFDLLADNKRLIDVFIGWINDQRGEHGVVVQKGPKDTKSHNKRELPKKPDWRHVELLDHEKGQGIPLSDAERARRRDAKVCATKFLPKIIEVFEGVSIKPDGSIAYLLCPTPFAEYEQFMFDRRGTVPELVTELESLWQCTNELGLTQPGNLKLYQ